MPNNTDKALIRHPSANIICGGDFNAHNKEWLVHSNETNSAGIFCHDFAVSQDLTQKVSFPTRIPDRVSLLVSQ